MNTLKEESKEEVCPYDVGGAPVVYSDKPPSPKNPLNRPQVNYKKCVLAVLGLILCVTVSFGACMLFLDKVAANYFSVNEKTVAILFSVAIGIIYILFILKRALIWMVHVYQRYAPDHVRLRCVFEPSCSEYMILSIKKYGSFVGVAKGIMRLLRCHPPNGGKDYP